MGASILYSRPRKKETIFCKNLDPSKAVKNRCFGLQDLFRSIDPCGSIPGSPAPRNEPFSSNICFYMLYKGHLKVFLKGLIKVVYIFCEGSSSVCCFNFVYLFQTLCAKCKGYLDCLKVVLKCDFYMF